MNLYLDIAKAEQRIASGIASTDTLDSQPGVMDGTPYVGDIVDPDAIKGALADYLEWRNVRLMHQPIAVGTALTAEVIDGKLHLAVKVVDDDAWEKIKAGVLRGFSIGGRILKAVLEQLPDGRTIRRILELALTEISLVDRPANPDARILLFKMEDAMPGEPEATPTPATLDAATIAAIKLLAGTGQPLAKAATDPTKIVSMIQQARNELELAGDMDGASLMTQAIALIQQATGEASAPEGSPEEEATEPPAEAQAEGDVPAGGAVTRNYKATKTGTLKKAGRKFSGANLAAMENTVKTLLQMMATAGSTKAQKAMIAMADGDELSMTQAIGAEFTKAVTPIAGAVLNINDRLAKIEAQPLPGGPVIRAPIQKQISGQAAPAESKPVMSVLVRQQLDNLQRMARTAANPSLAKLYDDQYTLLKAEYSE
jgi:HK97 family phage prohead protease